MLAEKVISEISNQVVIFIVHSVPLVHQQSMALRSILENKTQFKIGAFHGDAKIKNWDTTKKDFNIIVITAQLFLNKLNDRVISLDDISLLVRLDSLPPSLIIFWLRWIYSIIHLSPPPTFQYILKIEPDF